MTFKQYKDGSCEWLFSEQEIKILNEKGKFILTPESFKAVANDLIKIVADFQRHFPEHVQKQNNHDYEVDLSN